MHIQFKIKSRTESIMKQNVALLNSDITILGYDNYKCTSIWYQQILSFLKLIPALTLKIITTKKCSLNWEFGFSVVATITLNVFRLENIENKPHVLHWLHTKTHKF
jgi:hypothetical protein